ncbi:MAG: ribosomal-protein-alanine N-acetyltransferase [Parvicella sp.]|jgi:ribosomal-protein-alanine N-acetyltransferase
MNWNLNTEHYYVRFADAEDIQNIYALLGSNDVVKNHPKNPMVVEAQAMDEARRMVMQFEAKEAAFWLVEEKSTGKVIARLSLQKFNWVSASAQLRVDVFNDYKTQPVLSELIYAVATLAYEDLSLHRIEWFLLAEDTGSTKLAKAFGFNHDGQLMNFVEFEGSWIDYQVFSLLKTDDVWQQAIKNQGLPKS